MPPTIHVAREREATSIGIDEVYRDGRFDILPEVQSKDYFDIRFQGDRLRITAGKYVGLIPLNERVFIQVEPKMPVTNLMAVLNAVGGDLVELPVLEREYQAAPAAPPQILEAIAFAFSRALEHLEVGGLNKSYESVTVGGPTLKGQIRFNDSLQQFWSRGTRHAAVCTYFDLSADLPENRLLRYACHVLLVHVRTTGTPKRSVRSLAHFEEWLGRAGVELARPNVREFPPSRTLSPVYDRAIRLARLIVSGHGIELPAGGSDVALPSFLVNMETVFERYVRHILTNRLTGVDVLDGNTDGEKPLFDDRVQPPANPDVVIQRTAGDWPLLVEVKYKAVETRDDVEQVLAYALAYRTDQIVIALPSDPANPTGLTTIGRVSGIDVLRYRLDLSSADLPAEEQSFADAMQRLIR